MSAPVPPPAAAGGGGGVAKPETDPRSYRVLTLPNNLRVALCSGPTDDKASASLTVDVGSLCEQEWGVHGLAHFCEHMLFLGTEKYPKEAEYKEYLAKHGGNSNASTSDERTQYYFAASPGALEGALDRMSQFFVAPLFTADATERELNAIDNEHKRNLKNDERRLLQLLRNAAREEHPLNHFRTGNLTTLKEDPARDGVDVRAALLAFHGKWYSANRMALGICGPQDLDELERLARGMFGAVADKGKADAEFPADAFAGLPHLQYAHPVQDQRYVRFDFVTRDWRDRWRGKPGRYWSHLLGHEGPGSVLSALKRRGLATGLSAGVGYYGGGLGIFRVTVSTTQAAATPDAAAEIGEVLFAYLAMARREGAQQWLWDEARLLSDLEFRFRPTPNPASCAQAVSAALLQYPAEHLIDGGRCVFDYSRDDVDAHLAELVPQRARVTVMYPGAPQCDRTERWFGVPHSAVLPVPEAWARRWQAAEGPAAAELHLPAPNPFIPKDLALRAAPDGAAAEAYPVPLGRGATWRGFFLQDRRHGTRKVVVRAVAHSPWVAESTLNYVLADVWTHSVCEEINEVAYDAEVAGLSYDLSASAHGINVVISGYPDQIPAAIDMLLSRAPSAAAHALVIDRTEKRLRNWCLARQAHEYAAHWSAGVLTDPFRSHPDRLAALPGATHAAAAEVPDRVRAAAYVEALVQGNVTAAEARALVESLAARLSARPPARLPRRASAVLSGRDGVLQRPRPQPADPNEAVEVTVDVGAATPERRGVTQLIVKVLHQKFFDDLRTKQQLGYIVSASCVLTRGGAYRVRMVVQSGKHPAAYLRDRIAVFLTEMADTPAGIDEAAFAEYRDGVINQLTDRPKRVTEEVDRNWDEVCRRTLHFAWREEAVAALRRLSREDFAREWARFLAAPTFTVLVGPTEAREPPTPAEWREADRSVPPAEMCGL